MVVMGVDVYNVGGNVGEAGCGTGLMVVMVSLLGRCGALVGGQWPPSQQYYYRGDAAAAGAYTPIRAVTVNEDSRSFHHTLPLC